MAFHTSPHNCLKRGDGCGRPATGTKKILERKTCAWNTGKLDYVGGILRDGSGRPATGTQIINYREEIQSRKTLEAITAYVEINQTDASGQPWHQGNYLEGKE